MFSIIKKLLFSRQLSFEQGEIKLLGQSVTMIPVVLFSSMFKELKRNEPENYRKIIYDIAKEVGKTYTKVLKEKYGMGVQKLTEWDMNTLELAGLGKGEMLKLDIPNKKVIIKVINSPIAREMKPSNEPVDLIISGYIAGSVSVAFNSIKIVCREVKCQSMGNPYCLFEVFEEGGKI